MPPTNDRDFVRRVVTTLDRAGVGTWIFGGWAEELHGLCPPRPHKDVDLLYPADDFAAVDAFLASEPVEEIPLKRFAHKRAFVLEDVMIELFLVRTGGGLVTDFWGTERHNWPADTLGAPIDDLRVASVAALRSYRASFDRLSSYATRQ